MMSSVDVNSSSYSPGFASFICFISGFFHSICDSLPLFSPFLEFNISAEFGNLKVLALSLSKFSTPFLSTPSIISHKSVFFSIFGV